jgi:hypothetical protein
VYRFLDKVAGALTSVGSDDDPPAGDRVLPQFRQVNLLIWRAVSKPLLECVLNNAQGPLLSRALDAHDVKAVIYITKPMRDSILFCHSTDLFLLAEINRFFGSPMFQMSAEFDFDERQNILVTTNQINFAESALVFASNDPVTIGSQEMIGN